MASIGLAEISGLVLQPYRELGIALTLA